MKGNNYDEAASEYQKILNPSHADAHLGSGNCYLARGRYDEAIIEYLRVLEIVPNQPEAYYYLGIAYDKQKNYKKEIESYDLFMKFKPDYPDSERLLQHISEMKKL